ncbi:MAG TPA: ABC transporter substrate-binding protein [Candidatus Limnocylindrales bacterium]
MRVTSRFVGLVVAAVMLAACTGAAASPSTSTAAPATQPPASASAPAASPSPSADACGKGSLKLTTAGKLTIGTDNPAFPPYFDPDPKDPAWQLGNPKNGKGFESAVAYAVADKLGFSKDEVTWVVVPFDNSFKPGKKSFDFDLSQISYDPVRAQAVDMSDGYYFVNQSVVALKGSPLASAKTVADMKAYKFGAQVGTTSYNTIVTTIAPSKAPAVYDTNDKVVQALKVKQIDGLVVDLPTAFYITGAQLPNSVIVGQFPNVTGATAEHFSLVLQKGSALTPCVNAAIAALKADGTLDQITKEWLSDKASAPVIQP